jgi:bidirectional [NiFe] hydrogenase diaphorase subunit
MITLTVNGKKTTAEEGTTLLEVLRKLSISVPTLCYHPDLTPQGSCRLCSVEVRENGRSRLVTSCNYPVRRGIEVKTHSTRVLRARRVLVELLLARCPQVAAIQELAREFGIKQSRFKTLDPENTCILCGLCVRTCQEIVGASAIDFSSRGISRQVGTPFHIDTDQCVACGACEYVCPTGAIGMEMDRIRTMRQSDTGTLRTCRYMRLGLVDFMICSNGFECWRCEFDQTMMDRFDTHPVFATKPAQKRLPVQISGFTFMPGLLYSGHHVWVNPMAQRIRCGLDDLGSLFAAVADGVGLPSVGASLTKNETLIRLAMDKKKIEIPSPIGGKISAVNQDVLDDPTLIWRAPYEQGWLVVIEPDRAEDLSELESGRSVQSRFAQQVADVTALLMERSRKIRGKGTDPGTRVMSHDAPLVRDLLHSQWDRIRDMVLARRPREKGRKG